MLIKLIEWSRRLNYPAGALAPLGFAAECWLADARLYEGHEQLSERYKALGRRVSRSYIAEELSPHLLSDVLVAAGGIEGALQRLRASHAELQVVVRENRYEARPGVPHGLSDEAAVSAWYAFTELLMWGRTLTERMERRAGNSKKFPNQGLLPALKPKRLKAQCLRLFLALQSGPVGQSRSLANFVLHTALVNHPHTGVQLEPSGAIVLPVPELPGRQVAHWYLLSWRPGHDGFALAEDTWKHVQFFVDGLLTAFEEAVPKRLRKP
jgi:hypothetical protein